MAKEFVLRFEIPEFIREIKSLKLQKFYTFK